MFASIFAKTVVPFTTAPAAAVFIDDAMARGESGPRTAVGVVVVLVVHLLTALPFVLAGTVALVLRDRLVAFAVVGTALFVAFTGAVLLLLVLSARRPPLLERLLAACGAAVNRSAALLRRAAPLPGGWAARRRPDGLARVLRSIPDHSRDIAIASGYGVLLHLANLAGLGAVFLAFGQGLDLAALAAGFGTSIVFVQLGMPPTTAILVTLAYRILNVWIPVAIGFWCARRLRPFGATERARAGLSVIEAEAR